MSTGAASARVLPKSTIGACAGAASNCGTEFFHNINNLLHCELKRPLFGVLHDNHLLFHNLWNESIDDLLRCALLPTLHCASEEVFSLEPDGLEEPLQCLDIWTAGACLSITTGTSTTSTIVGEPSGPQCPVRHVPPARARNPPSCFGAAGRNPLRGGHVWRPGTSTQDVDLEERSRWEESWWRYSRFNDSCLSHLHALTLSFDFVA